MITKIILFISISLLSAPSTALSDDTITFTPLSSGLADYGLRDMTYGNSLYDIVAAGNSTSNGNIIVSTNGTNWELSDSLP